MSLSNGLCYGSILNILDSCVLSIWSSTIPAGLVLLYVLFSLPWPSAVKRTACWLSTPFRSFISLEEAKSFLASQEPGQDPKQSNGHAASAPNGVYANGNGTHDSPKDKAARVGPPMWKTVILSTIALAEAVAWLVLGSFKLIEWTSSSVQAWEVWPPFLLAVVWLYAAVLPIFRPRATAPFDLFALFVANTLSACIFIGSRLFLLSAYGVPLPSALTLVALVVNLLACLSLVSVVLSMPLALPSSQAEKEAIGVTASPEDYTSLWGFMTFSWVSPLVKKGTYATLNDSDVWDLSPTNKARAIYSRWVELRRSTTLRTLAAANTQFLILDFLLINIVVVLSFAGPFFLKRILDAIMDPTREARSIAYLYAFLAFVTTIVKAEAEMIQRWLGKRSSIRARLGLMAAIYDKALRRKDMSGVTDSSPTTEGKSDGNSKGKGAKPAKAKEEPKDSAEADIGKIVQLMSSDANRLSMWVGEIDGIWQYPLEIVLSSAFLYELLGWSAFAGFAVVILVAPLNTYLSKRRVQMSRTLLAARDKRMALLTEMFGAIKFIKFFAWEPQWIDRVQDSRRVELNLLIKNNINSLAFMFTWQLVPVFIAVISLGTFVMIGNELTVSIAFTAIALFNRLSSPLTFLPTFIVQMLQTGVSLNRIDAFIDEGEVPDYVSSLKRAPVDSLEDADTQLGLEGATCQWNISDKKDEKSAKAVKGEGSIKNSVTTHLKRVVFRAPSPTSEDVVDGASTEPQKPFELTDITVSFPVGKFTVVTGPTASGKTALLMSLLGEMTLESGKAHLPKNPTQVDEYGLKNCISYAAQSSWLQHRTIKTNILFGSPLEEDRYEAVVEACALKPDFAILEDGDQTEIGARGVTLSGGQKARVALARAAYARTKHVLLDDPLAALDSHSARYVFEKLLMGPLMENRTVILVTHHLDLVLPGAHYLVRMLDGRIDTQGTVEELRERGVLGDIAQESQAEENHEPAPVVVVKSAESVLDATPADSAQTTTPSKPKNSLKARKLVKEEARAEGNVSWKIYKTYLEASSIYVWTFVALAMMLGQAIGIGEKVWIKIWGEHYEVGFRLLNTMTMGIMHAPNHLEASPVSAHFVAGFVHTAVNHLNVFSAGATPPDFTTAALPSASDHPFFYVGIYAAFGLVRAVVWTIRTTVQYIAAYTASLFSRVLVAVTRAPIRWFETTPTGRILNRFSRDVETIDSNLAQSISQTGGQVATLIASLVVIGTILPPFLVPAAFLGYAYYRIAIGYVNAGRDLRRMESNTKSPIFSGFAEMLDGIVSVRAFSAEGRLFGTLYEKLDLTTKMYYYFWMTNRWLLLRFETLGGLSVLFTTLLGLSGYIDAGLAGLTITSAMNFSLSLYWTCRTITTLEMDLNAVERVVEYLDLPAEPPAVVESNRPPAYWPSHKTSDSFVVVEDLVIKYSPELPPVLHGVSFTLSAREKVGLVGRTGSGKSTLAMSLLRFVEPTSGKIIIDGIDICKIGLLDLRSRVTIIPQDAVLFSGTIRENLDPFLEHTDADCYDALSRVQLISESRAASQRPSRAPSPSPPTDEEGTVAASSASSTVAGEERTSVTLETKVSAGGSNFSQGQRQLLAMARALLRQSSVIVMDEATASVDFETDSKIQHTIREEFQNSLLLTVAHRIRTIIDYDRLIVLDNGHVAEFDTPYNLLQKDDGIFKSMCENSGMYQELVDTAETKHKGGS